METLKAGFYTNNNKFNRERYLKPVSWSNIEKV